MQKPVRFFRHSGSYAAGDRHGSLLMFKNRFNRTSFLVFAFTLVGGAVVSAASLMAQAPTHNASTDVVSPSVTSTTNSDVNTENGTDLVTPSTDASSNNVNVNSTNGQTNVSVDGQTFDVPSNGSTHKVINNGNSSLELDVNNSNDGTGSSSSNVSVNSHSRSTSTSTSTQHTLEIGTGH
ncbi:MAG TPA: hypothetical protein VLF87_02720, partial [Patescibacteria group bacterium]|nr:hypothetical protein [Patescibacteria group bacterium]